MHPLPGLAQVVLRAAGDDIFLERDIIVQNLFERQRFRLAVGNRQHNHAERHLHLRHGIQLVQHNLRRRVFFHVDHDAHPVAVGVIGHIRNAFDPFFLRRWF